jgi:hypothetical protein
MSIAILNMISFTSLFSQLLLVILYTLGVLFYKFNKTVTKDLDKEINPLNTIESVEYFSEDMLNPQPNKKVDFENFDDYSAFSKEKAIDVNRSESGGENLINEVETLEQIPNKMEGQTATEMIDESVEDYVQTNSILTATVQEEDFEETNFDLSAEQENSITMVDEDDIKRVFRSKDWAVRH